MRNYRSVVGLALIALGVTSLAGGVWGAQPKLPVVVSIKTSDGRGADALVDTWNLDANLGAAPAAGVKQLNGGRKLYLRFDLASVKDPIKGAVLDLPVVSGSKGYLTYNVFGVIDGDADNWTEGTGGAAAAAPAAPAKGKGKGKSTAATPTAAPPAASVSGTAAPAKPADGITAATAPAVDTKSGGGKYDPDKKTGGGVDNSKTVFLGTFCVNNENYSLSKRKASIYFGAQELVDFLGKDTNKLVTLIITRVEADRGSWTDFGTKEGGNPAILKVSSEPMPFPAQPVPPGTPAKPAATGTPAAATATATN